MRKAKYPMRHHQYTARSVERLTPSVMRVVAGPGPETPADQWLESRGLAAETLRVVVPADGSAVPPPPERDGERFWWPKPGPPTRKYTIRHHDPATGEVEINVMVHDEGPGTHWSRRVAPGDPVHLLGPKSGIEIPVRQDFWVMAGDETGWPGMARWIESLPDDARGVVAVEVAGPEAEQQLRRKPAGVAVEWVHHGGVPGRGLAEAVLAGVDRAGGLPPGESFLWLAGEDSSIRPLRDWARQQPGLDRDHVYAKGYWTRRAGR